MGRKCDVKDCASDSNRPEDKGVTYHKVPGTENIRNKWFQLCRITGEKKTHKVVYVCSRHFLRADFCNFRGRKYVLKQGVLPSVFPWDKSKLQAIKAKAKKEKKPSEGRQKRQQKTKEEEPPSAVNSSDDNPENDKKSEVSLISENKIEDTKEFVEKAENVVIKKEIFEEDEVLEEKVVLQEKIEIEETVLKGEGFFNEDSHLVEEPPRKKQKIKLEAGIKQEIPEEKPPENTEQPPAEESESLTISANKLTELELKAGSLKDSGGQIGNTINFSINSRLEVLDFNDCWYPARIVEIDYEENEVLIHFEKFSSKYDEWICMDSPRLRTFQQAKKAVENYIVGERVLAVWCDNRKFPATVTKILNKDTYEVLFDDGFMKTIKAHKMSKASPLFDPVKGTKQERRDKKRKINSVAALFGKKGKSDSGADGHPDGDSANEKEKENDADKEMSNTQIPPTDDFVEQYSYTPLWENGRPVGVDGFIETNDGKRPSIIVPDPRMPPGWQKHFVQRQMGSSAGKWEVVIVSADNRRLRSRADVKSYLENHPELGVMDIKLFDFSTKVRSGLKPERDRRRNRNDKNKNTAATATTTSSKESATGKSSTKKSQNLNNSVDQIIEKVIEDASIGEEGSTLETASEVEEESAKEEKKENDQLLKIPMVDNAYKCPIEGCGKNFRRENLAQMHVKHYHPKYTKFLDWTPNVADLAYARTVGEHLEKSPAAARSSPSHGARQSTKLTGSGTTKGQSASNKDEDIVKSISTNTLDKSENDQTIASGLPATNINKDVKLRDLLLKTDPPTSNVNRPSTGIKTLLPVRSSHAAEDGGAVYGESSRKRKRDTGNISLNQSHLDTTSAPQSPLIPATQQLDLTTSTTQLNQQSPMPELYPQVPNNIIIEGGEVIKIVRMKQEEIINCTCGFTEEDGLMIQCELCLCWQHAYCNNIERENQVPEKYICYICQNPLRERSSRKYYHDQDWLKHGTLATGSYHSKDEEVLQKRFEKLKKAHDISGALVELREYVHHLGVKLKIAEAKNHPKLYLWSKPWEKLPLPEKMKEESNAKSDLKEEEKPEQESMLMMMLKEDKDEKKEDDGPIIPKPEAAINSLDCRLNLLDHISHAETLVEERLDNFEKLLDALEDGMDSEIDHNYPKTRQTIQMLMRDLDTLKEFSQINSIA